MDLHARRFYDSAGMGMSTKRASAVIELNSPSIQFDVTYHWSAALGASPASPDWRSGAAMSLLAARFEYGLDNSLMRSAISSSCGSRYLNLGWLDSEQRKSPSAAGADRRRS